MIGSVTQSISTLEHIHLPGTPGLGNPVKCPVAIRDVADTLRHTAATGQSLVEHVDGSPGS